MKTATVVILACAAALAVGALPAADPPAKDKAAGEPQAGTVITNSIGMKLAYIPAGKFMMGSPADEAERDDNEMQHEVTLSKPFYMGVYEVSQREFKSVRLENVKRGAIFNENRGGSPDHPVE